MKKSISVTRNPAANYNIPVLFAFHWARAALIASWVWNGVSNVLVLFTVQSKYDTGWSCGFSQCDIISAISGYVLRKSYHQVLADLGSIRYSGNPERVHDGWVTDTGKH